MPIQVVPIIRIDTAHYVMLHIIATAPLRPIALRAHRRGERLHVAPARGRAKQILRYMPGNVADAQLLAAGCAPENDEHDASDTRLPHDHHSVIQTHEVCALQFAHHPVGRLRATVPEG